MKAISLLVLVAVAICASGCGQSEPRGGPNAPPPNVSNQAIIHAALNYKACPGEPETLQQVADRVLAEAHADVVGTGVFRRIGDQAHVAIAYQQAGNQGEATFIYNMNSVKLVGANALGDILSALSAEC